MRKRNIDLLYMKMCKETRFLNGHKPDYQELLSMIDDNDIDAELDFWWSWRDDSGGILDPRDYCEFDTMKQLLLAYIMEKKYNMKWVNNKWVEIEDD